MRLRQSAGILAALALLPLGQAAAQDTVKAEGPIFIAHDVEPVLQNTTEIRQLLGRMYPDALRLTGREGKVILWVFVEEDGSVGSSEVLVSGGHPAFDEAAMKVADEMVFTPAEWQGEPVGVWINQAIVFKPGDLKIREK